MQSIHPTQCKYYNECDKEVKRSAKKDKRDFVEELATQAQKVAEKNDMETHYNITKQLGGRKPNSNRPVKGKDGNVLSKPAEQLDRWREHFRELISGTPITTPPLIEEGEDLEMNLRPISKEEIIRAIGKTKSGKAPGPDNIPPEVLKTDAVVMADIVLNLFQEAWDKEEVPQEWRKGYIIKLPKKGDLSECKNWRGIQLLSLPSKILERIILERIRAAVDEKLRDEQAGFRAGRSCVDQIATLRIIIEQSLEWQSPLYINVVAFIEAFDTVDREVTWRILRHYGIPLKMVKIIQKLYEDTACHVIHHTSVSEPFDEDSHETTARDPVDTVLTQCCCMARRPGDSPKGWSTSCRSSSTHACNGSFASDLDGPTESPMKTCGAGQTRDKSGTPSEPRK